MHEYLFLYIFLYLFLNILLNKKNMFIMFIYNVK